MAISYIKVLTVLERISGKLDQLLFSQPERECSTKEISSVRPAVDSKRAPASARATRQKENLRPWDQAAEDSRTTGIQTREEARKVVQGYIRSCFLEALNIKATKDGLPPSPPDDVLGPTLESFYIKWDESVHSEFNQCACDLIVHKLSADFPKPFNEDNHDYLMQMVKNHVKYLKRAYSWC
ncbi:hypothetical protein FRC06_007946, partial [Ceratobasidium sp. 370]